MRTIAGIVVSSLVGIALAVVATFAIVQANGPDKAAEQSIQNKDFQQSREVVQYGQR